MTLTQQQEQFLFLAMIRQEKYRDIATTMNVERKQLTRWWNELKDERLKLAPVVKLWRRKCKEIGFSEFKKWFGESDRACYYCGITEPEITRLIDSRKIHTKRLGTRGRALEIDRKAPNEMYDNIDNLVLCCYWCNNAKTDEFSADEFKRIGQVIGEIWKARAE